MKKKSNKIILCAFVAALLFASAAESAAQQVEIGLRYNPEFTWLVNKNDDGAGSALDLTRNFGYFSFGAGAIYYFDTNFGVAADLLFSREGQRFEGNFNGTAPDPATYSSVVRTQAFLNNIVLKGDYVAKAELNYIKLPIMLSFTSDNTMPLFISVLIGPQFNFLKSAVQEVNHEDLDYPNSNIAPRDLYKTVTISGVLAFGGAYNVTPGMVLSARYRLDYGLMDVEKKDAMVSYAGATPVHFYSPNRLATRNVTGALMIGLDFKI